MTETPDPAHLQDNEPAPTTGLPAAIWVPGVIVILGLLMWLFAG